MERLAIIVEWIVLVLITPGLFVASKKRPHSRGHNAQRWMLAAVGPAVLMVFMVIRGMVPVGWRIALMLLVFALLLAAVPADAPPPLSRVIGLAPGRDAAVPPSPLAQRAAGGAGTAQGRGCRRPATPAPRRCHDRWPAPPRGPVPRPAPHGGRTDRAGLRPRRGALLATGQGRAVRAVRPLVRMSIG